MVVTITHVRGATTQPFLVEEATDLATHDPVKVRISLLPDLFVTETRLWPRTVLL